MDDSPALMQSPIIMFPIAAVDTTHLIIGIVALVAIGFVWYFIARVLKGKIELELPKNGYSAGEAITGRVTLTSKKPLPLKRMVVALIGYEITTTERDGDRKTRRKEVYRNEVNILDAQDVPAGVNQTFEFTMNAPGGGATAVEARIGKAADAVAGALSVLGVSSSRRRMEWKVEARCDLPGVDLVKTRKVQVNNLI